MAYRKVWLHRRWSKRCRRHVFCLRWNEDGKARQETLDGPERFSREEARALAREREAELNAGSYRRVVNKSFAEFCAEDLALLEGRRAATSLKDVDGAYRIFAKLTGVRDLASITPLMLERFYAERCKAVTVETANKNIRTLKAGFQRAVARGYLKQGENPGKSLGLTQPPQKRIRVLDLAEIGRLRNVLPDLQWKTFIEVALTSGLRRGELINLTWGDVNLDAKALLIRCKETWGPKRRRERLVFMSDGAAEYLRQLKVSRGLAATPDAFVFLSRTGGQWKKNVTESFGRLVALAEIAPSTIHDLRRTCASWGAMSGENEAVVQAHLGHTQIATTLKYYTNVLASKLRELPNRLPYVRSLSAPEGEVRTQSLPGSG